MYAIIVTDIDADSRTGETTVRIFKVAFKKLRKVRRKKRKENREYWTI